MIIVCVWLTNLYQYNKEKNYLGSLLNEDYLSIKSFITKHEDFYGRNMDIDWDNKIEICISPNYQIARSIQSNHPSYGYIAERETYDSDNFWTIGVIDHTKKQIAPFQIQRSPFLISEEKAGCKILPDVNIKGIIGKRGLK